MKRWKTLPWVLGVAVLAISLVAANRLFSKDDNKATEPGGGATAPANLGGLTIEGTVDSDPTVLRIDPPGIVGLPALTIKKVLVKEGDIVKPGDVLIQFDDSQFVPEKLMAEKKLLAAEYRVMQAKLVLLDYPKKLKQQKSVVDLAETKHADAVRIRDSAYATARTSKSVLVPLTPEEREEQIKNSLELIGLDNSVKQAKINWDNEKNTYERLETAKIDVNGQLLNSADLEYRAALDEVEAVRAGLKKVEAVIEAFKLKALVEGEIECLMASEGMTFSPTTRTMMMYLVPTGPRVVRGVVEAEFASKVNAQVGKTVTIRDSFNFNLTYTGTVRRVSSTYLPKRFGADALVANNNRVLECTIDVPNPNPAGKPPLRPGQPVRVTFGP